jgi:hypothetical protein
VDALPWPTTRGDNLFALSANLALCIETAFATVLPSDSSCTERFECKRLPALPCQRQASSSDLPSNRLLKAKQELVSVTADRRVEHIFGVIVGLVCKN